MGLEFDRIELEKLMKDFYVLTGIRIVLFDAEYHALLAYPAYDCSFCRCMKSHSATEKLCRKSDETSFKACKDKNSLIVYHCHAGLIEAAAPLIDNHTVIGYLMFGQISDEAAPELLTKTVTSALRQTSVTVPLLNTYLAEIPLKSGEQIEAAAKIMEACTFYVILKNTISVKRSNFIHNMDNFLLSHLNEDLSVERITREFGISKSKLYQVCGSYLGCGIGEYVHTLRIEHAKHMLKETDIPVTQISDACGFSDYNYFCRIFKRDVGISAKKYRNLYR